MQAFVKGKSKRPLGERSRVGQVMTYEKHRQNKKENKKQKKDTRNPPGGGSVENSVAQFPFKIFDCSGISKKDERKLAMLEGSIAYSKSKQLEREMERTSKQKVEHMHSPVRAGWNGVMTELEKERHDREEAAKKSKSAKPVNTPAEVNWRITKSYALQ